MSGSVRTLIAHRHTFTQTPTNWKSCEIWWSTTLWCRQKFRISINKISIYRLHRHAHVVSITSNTKWVIEMQYYWWLADKLKSCISHQIQSVLLYRAHSPSRNTDEFQNQFKWNEMKINIYPRWRRAEVHREAWSYLYSIILETREWKLKPSGAARRQGQCTVCVCINDCKTLHKTFYNIKLNQLKHKHRIFNCIATWTSSSSSQILRHTQQQKKKKRQLRRKFSLRDNWNCLTKEKNWFLSMCQLISMFLTCMNLI